MNKHIYLIMLILFYKIESMEKNNNNNFSLKNIIPEFLQKNQYMVDYQL